MKCLPSNNYSVLSKAQSTVCRAGDLLANEARVRFGKSTFANLDVRILL